MGQFIHRNGDQYRVWSTEWDRYITEPLTRAEMEQHLRERGYDAVAREVAERLARADAQGTSVQFETRDVDAWDEERCDECGAFHHAPDAACHGPRCSSPQREITEAKP